METSDLNSIKYFDLTFVDVRSGVRACVRAFVRACVRACVRASVRACVRVSHNINFQG